LGLCKYRTGDYAEAISAYKKAAELDPARKEEYERGIALCATAKPISGKTTTSKSALAAHFCLGLAMTYNAVCVLLGFTAGAAWVAAKNRAFVIVYVVNSIALLLRVYGQPRLHQEYWAKVMVDNTATRLLGGLCLMLGPNVLLLVALVIPELASLASTAVVFIRGVKPSVADAVVRLFEATLLDKHGAPFWKVAQFSAFAEVAAFVYLIVTLVTPRRNMMQLIIFGQSLQMRVMIEKASQRTSGVMHVAFASLDTHITGLVNKFPGIVGTAYRKFKALVARQVTLPDPNDKAKSRCSLM